GHQGRPGPPGPAAGGRAGRRRDPRQRRQPRRGGPRLGHLRQGVGGPAGGRVRRPRGAAGRVLRPADPAQARGPARARRRRRVRPGRRRPVAHHRPARPGRRRGRGRVPQMRDDGVHVAVDLGASSGRGVVARGGGGGGGGGPSRLEVEEVPRFPNEPVALPDGLHWDILRLYREVVGGLRAAGGAGPVVSVGVDGWGVDYALLDETGALLGNPYSYRDGRTAGVADKVHARWPFEELYPRTGVQLLPFNTVYQLAAAAGTPQLEAARTLLLLPDLLGYWLTGTAGAEATNASTTALLDVRTGDWSPEALAAAGVGRDLLPALRRPGEPLGPLRAEVAAETGLPGSGEGTAVGSHDTASAVVGVPADGDRFAYISCGTWGLVGVE